MQMYPNLTVVYIVPVGGLELLSYWVSPHHSNPVSVSPHVLGVAKKVCQALVVRSVKCL